jgi:prepilin-type N-terminal cleavage/methylation domain-containing protein
MMGLKLCRDKVQGFTLLEQIVVLALTSFVALIGFIALMNFQRLILLIQRNASEDREVYQLNTALNNDFRNSLKIIWDGSLTICKPSQEIRYEFNGNYIIRETKEVLDSFRLYAIDINVTGLKTDESIVKYFSFTVKNGDQRFQLKFLKEYTESELWELNCQK